MTAVVTSLLWGRYLLPGRTLSPEAQVPTLAPACRLAGAELACVQNLGLVQSVDPGAPAWVEIPASYYFRTARAAEWGHPSWSPYIGSGYPIALDGHNASTSLTRILLSYLPGDEGRDALIVARYFFWTLGIVLALALLGVGGVALAVGALAAGTAPYASSFVDHVMLDVDLLAPWFPVILLAYGGHRLSLGTAATLAFGLGALVSSLGFIQAQAGFCVSVAVVSVAALGATRSRSLLVGLAAAAGFALLAPTWIPLLRHLGEFVSSRNVHCFVSRGLGFWEVWRQLTDPMLAVNAPFASTLAGLAVVPFAPRAFRFGIVALALLLPWLIFGLPEAACGIPLFAGIRFQRHLQPHVQALFLVAAIAGADALAKGQRRGRTWLLVTGVLAIGSVVLSRASLPLHEPATQLLLVHLPVGGGGAMALLLACVLAYPDLAQTAVLGTIIAAAVSFCAAGWRCSESLKSEAARRASPGLATLGMLLVALAPSMANSRIFPMNLAGVGGSASIASLPLDLSSSSALGAVRELSASQDRRHYSPAGYVYPNWGQAIGLMEMLSLQALYPRHSHELNGALFSEWERDPQHGISPDRFVPVPPSLAMSLDFQRVLAVNRVSLLTFRTGETFFGEPGSPYERDRCRLLARTPAQRAESWLCAAVRGVGFFPSVVRSARTRPDALAIIKGTSPAALVELAVLGPEIDLRIDAETVPEPPAGEGEVLRVDRRGDDLVYILDVRRSGVFVIADTYFTGWSARVNGMPAGISRANVAFKAVRVPAGRVELRLHFSLD
jgi:hypothetical protein